MARIATGIAVDVVLTLVLLMGLSAVHFFLSHTEGSEDFRMFFSRIHECFVLVASTLIALKGLIRIWEY